MKIELEIPDQILSFLKAVYGEECLKEELEYLIVDDFRARLTTDLGEYFIKEMVKKHGLAEVKELMEDTEFKNLVF